MKKVLIPIIVFVIVFAVVIFCFWCGGMDFVRSESLGGAVTLSFFLSSTCSAISAAIILE